MAEQLSIQVPITGSVIEQLKHRRDLLIRTDENPLDANELMQLNNKGAWVILASSANLPNDDVKNINKLARENILTGGIVSFDVDSESNYTLRRRGGLNFGDTKLGGYDQNSQLGFRPMPGITDLTIASKTTFGALRQVEIGIKAWNQDQLTVLEKLYFRPGFTMFVEFGNAGYIDAKGNITSKNESLYLNFIKGKKLSLIKSEIKKRRIRSGYNYDALIGKVQNFSWSLAKDGSYDCSLKLISQGELAESLSIIGYDKKKETPEKIRNSNKNLPNDLLLNMLLTMNTITGPGTTSNFEKAFSLKKGDGTVFYSYPSSGASEEVTSLNATEQAELASAQGITREELLQGGPQRFIPLYSLFKILNTKFVKPLLKSQKSSSDDDLKLFETDVTSSRYTYFPSLISNDPFVCSLPKDDDVFKYMYGGQYPRESIVSDAYYKNAFGEDYSLFSPYFILVNVQCLIGIQKAFLDQKKQNISLNFSAYTFAKKVLELVSSALGGICELDLHKDEDSETWIVIDRNCNDTIDSAKAIPALDLVGLGSLITDIKLESKISSNLASQLAIAATATGGSGADQALTRLNSGVTDRYVKLSDDEETQKELKEQQKKEDDEALIENISKIGAAYKSYVQENNHSKDNFESITSDHANYASYQRKVYNETAAEYGKTRKFDGLIPFDLSFTLDGIAGLRVTDCFTVQKNILPDRYNGNVGFIITNVDHSIGSDNRWITEITSKMFMLPATVEISDKLLEDPLEELKEKNQDSKIQPNIRAQYGEPGDESVLKSIKVPEGFNLTYGGSPVKSIRIHKDVADNLYSAMTEVLQVYQPELIQDLRINIYQGSYNNRRKRGGTTFSTHAWGIALDFDADNNKLKWDRSKATFAKEEYKQFLEIFKKHGFYNLGTEKNYDYMHFQAWDPNQPE